ncbi:MAG TPA: hypothetical protein VGG32_06910 [Thermoplasmata archaeon]
MLADGSIRYEVAVRDGEDGEGNRRGFPSKKEAKLYERLARDCGFETKMVVLDPAAAVVADPERRKQAKELALLGGGAALAYGALRLGGVSSVSKLVAPSVAGSSAPVTSPTPSTPSDPAAGNNLVAPSVLVDPAGAPPGSIWYRADIGLLRYESGLFGTLSVAVMDPVYGTLWAQPTEENIFEAPILVLGLAKYDILSMTEGGLGIVPNNDFAVTTFNNVLDDTYGNMKAYGTMTASSYYGELGTATLATYPFLFGVFAPGQVLYFDGSDWVNEALSSVAVTSLSAGNGISLSGSTGAVTVSAKLDGTTLSLGSSGLSINLGNANSWSATQTFTNLYPGIEMLGPVSGPASTSSEIAFLGWSGSASIGVNLFADSTGSFKVGQQGSPYNTLLTVDQSGNLNATGTVTGSSFYGELDTATLDSVAFSFTSLTSGQVLYYNGSDWINKTLSGGGVSSLNGLTGAVTLTTPNSTLSIGTSGSDVTLDINLGNANSWSATQTFGNYISIGGASLDVSSLSSNEFLYYNGSNWVNSAELDVFELDGVAFSFGSLTSGQVLYYNGSNWINKTMGAGGVTSLNGLTGALTITTPNSTLSVGTSGSDVTIDINLSNANTWAAAQTFTKNDLLLLGTGVGATTLNSGLTGGSSNTLTLPTTPSDTLAALGTAQEWTAAQTFDSSDLLVFNPAKTFKYTIVASAIGGNYNLTLPPITGNDTLAALATAESWTATQTFGTNISFMGAQLSGSTVANGLLYYNGSNWIAQALANGNGITVSGTTITAVINGTTLSLGASGLSLNLSNANLWSAVQTFGNNISFGGATLNVTSLTTGNILQYNGTNWVNVTAASIAVVSSVSNSDGSLSISPTTGAVVASLNVGNANTWTAVQTFGNNISIGGAQLSVSGLASGNVLQYNGSNWVNATVASLAVAWSSLANPTAALALTMGATYTTAFTLQQTSGTGFTWTSSTLTTGVLAAFASTGTALSGTVSLVTIASTGANSNTAVTAQGLNISVANTNATSGTNVALYLAASGATTANTALELHAGQILSDAAQVWALKSNTASALQITDGTNGYITVNTQTATSGINGVLIGVTNPTLVAAAGIGFWTFSVGATTVTLTGSTGVTNLYGIEAMFARPTITDTSSVTVGIASTVYIAGAPATGGSVTITNPYALYVSAGATYFGGNLAFNGTSLNIGTASAYPATIYANSLTLEGTPSIVWSGTSGNIGSSSNYPAIVYTNSVTFEGATAALSGTYEIAGTPTVYSSLAWNGTSLNFGTSSNYPANLYGNLFTFEGSSAGLAGTYNIGGTPTLTATLTFSAAQIFAAKANTALAFKLTDGTNAYYTLNDQTGTVSTVTHTFNVGSAITVSLAAGSTFSMVSLGNFTYTDSATTTVTALNGMMLNVGTPTINQSGGAVTVTTASSVYIAAAPAAGGSVTITNAYSLYVAGGTSYFGGNLTFNGTSLAIGTASAYPGTIYGNTITLEGTPAINFSGTSGTIGSAAAYPGTIYTGGITFEVGGLSGTYSIGGTATVTGTLTFSGNSPMTFTGSGVSNTVPSNVAWGFTLFTAGGQYFGLNTQTGTDNTYNFLFQLGDTISYASAAGSSHYLVELAGLSLTLTGGTGVTALQGLELYVGQPAVTSSSATTVTTASTLYIAGAPSAQGSVSITNKYAIYVDAGTSYFPNIMISVSGNIYMGGSAGTGNGLFFTSPAGQTLIQLTDYDSTVAPSSFEINGVTSSGSSFGTVFAVGTVATASVVTAYNTLDDGSGNMTVVGTFSSHTINPSSDSSYSIGTNALRWVTVNVSSDLRIYLNASDANPVFDASYYSSTGGIIRFGVGGSTAVDTFLLRTGVGILSVEHTTGTSAIAFVAAAAGSSIRITGSSTGYTALATANTGSSNYTATLPAYTGNVVVTTTSSPASGDILYYNGSNWVDLAIGSANYLLTVISGAPSWQPAPAASSLAWSALANPSATLSLTFPAADTTTFTFSATSQTPMTWQTSTLTTGTLFALTSTSAALSGTVPITSITVSGTNTNASAVAEGLAISVTNTGTTSTNTALLLTASGASTNYAINIAAGGINSQAAQTWALKANTATGLQITDGTNSYITVNTQSATSGISAVTISATGPTIASSAGLTYTLFSPTSYTLTLTGTTTVTNIPGTNTYFTPTTITDVSTITVTTASTVYIGGAPTAAGSVTITNPYALYINSGATYFGGNLVFTGTSSTVGTSSAYPATTYLHTITLEGTGPSIAWSGTSGNIGSSSAYPATIYCGGLTFEAFGDSGGKLTMSPSGILYLGTSAYSTYSFNGYSNTGTYGWYWEENAGSTGTTIYAAFAYAALTLGSTSYYVSVGHTSATSDSRLKPDFMDYAGDPLAELKAVRFGQYKTIKDAIGGGGRVYDHWKAGVAAETLPDSVRTLTQPPPGRPEYGSYYSVVQPHYDHWIVGVLKAQQAEIEELKARIEELLEDKTKNARPAKRKSRRSAS